MSTLMKIFNSSEFESLQPDARSKTMACSCLCKGFSFFRKKHTKQKLNRSSYEQSEVQVITREVIILKET